MPNIEPNPKIGMAFVENVPSNITESEICQVFSHYFNVTSVFFLDDACSTNNDRFCWVGLINPEDKINELNSIEIAGSKLHFKLMGYFYPDQVANGPN